MKMLIWFKHSLSHSQLHGPFMRKRFKIEKLLYKYTKYKKKKKIKAVINGNKEILWRYKKSQESSTT